MITKLKQEDYFRQYKSIHDSIFSGRLVFQKPFEHLDWEQVLMPGGVRLKEDVFVALKKAAKTCGDNLLIATDCEASVGNPHYESVITDWDWNAFQHLNRVAPIIATMDSHLFGISCKWGVICYSDDFSCLGGSAEFLEPFIADLGGKEVLRKRFLQFNEHGWFIEDEMKHQILTSVGWI